MDGTKDLRCHGAVHPEISRDRPRHDRTGFIRVNKGEASNRIERLRRSNLGGRLGIQCERHRRGDRYCGAQDSFLVGVHRPGGRFYSRHDDDDVLSRRRPCAVARQGKICGWEVARIKNPSPVSVMRMRTWEYPRREARGFPNIL